MPIAEIVSLSAHAEKLGIIGVLMLICVVLGFAVKYFRTELIKTHAEFNRLKTAYFVVKSAADHAGVKYDLKAVSEFDDLVRDRG